MNSVKQFLIRVSGRIPKDNGKNMLSMFAGLFIIVFSLLVGIFTFFKGFDYFADLDKIKKEKFMGRIGEEVAAVVDMDSSKIGSDTSSVKRVSPEELELKPSEKLLKNNALGFALFFGTLSAVFSFFLLRLISSIEGKVSQLTRFFWWCAGVNTKILEECPNDHAKYYGIGGTIFFTALMATFAGGYAFYTAFHNVTLSIVFGFFWGAVIFNLDRYIVSSTGKGDGTQRITKEEWLNAMPRLILAILIGFVISTPLELKIFEREINVEIQKMINEERQNIKGGLTDIIQEIQRKKDRIAELGQEEKRLKEAILGQDPRIIISQNNLQLLNEKIPGLRSDLKVNQSKYFQYSSDLESYEKQMDSDDLSDSQRSSLRRKRENARSQRSRYERIVKSLEEQLAQLEKQVGSENEKILSVREGLSESYEDILKKNQNERERVNQEIAELERLLSGKNEEADDVSIQFNGFMARLLAIKRLSYTVDTIYERQAIHVLNPQISPLDSLSQAPVSSEVKPGEAQAKEVKKKRTPVFYTKWLIAALIICIEIAPILFKMMTEAGAYENRVEAEKMASESQKLKYISDINEQINLELKLNSEVNESKRIAEKEANRRLLQAIANAQTEIAEKAIEEWKNRQIAKISENPDLIIKTNDEA